MTHLSYFWRRDRRPVSANFMPALIGLTTWLALPPGGAIAGDMNVPVSQPVAVNSSAAGDTGHDHSPALAMGGGVCIAAWHSDEAFGSSIGSDNDIIFARSVDFGQSWSAASPLNTNAWTDGANSSDRFPSLARGLGAWICVWQSDDPLGGAAGGVDIDIFVARSFNEGQTWTAPAVLNSNAALFVGNDFDPVVATDGSGAWVVVWRSIDSLGGTIGTDADILAARSTDAGATWSNAAPLNTNATGDCATCQDLHPHIAAGNGVWVAAWHSNTNLGGIGSDYDIFFSRSVNGGVTWSAPQPLNSNANADSGADMDVQLATDGNGTWIAVWASEDSLGGTIGTDRDILWSRSGNDGVTWSAPQPLNSNALGDAGADNWPRIVTDRQGRWMAAWHSNDTLGGTLGGDTDILYATSIDNGLTWAAAAALNRNAGSDIGLDELPALACDPIGAWMAVWESRDSLGGTIGADYDILFCRLAAPDCNRNTLPDASEPDANGNGVPDDCDEPGPPPCPTDVNGDGVRNFDDVLAVIFGWGACVSGPPFPPPPCPQDVNGDGVANFDDVLAIIFAWGPCE